MIMEKNLTNGNVLRTILSFSLPFLLSYFLQTLYGMADLFIIGQFNGADSTTAVSIGSQITHMVTVMIVGLAMGATVTIGKAVGAQRRKEAAHIISNTITLFACLSVVIMIVLLVFVRGIVSIMSTPSEAVDGTISYLTICFMGIPFITAYNVISSVFRGLGDSKSPMYFVAIACAANIVLDYLLIGALHLGPAGAALGTTLSQTLSVLLSLLIIRRRDTGFSLKRSYFRPQRQILSPLLKTGLPVAFQDGFIQISFIVITVIANRRGLNDAAAVGIVEKIISFLFLVPSSMLSSVSALAAQNIGAGKHRRARATLGYAMAICVAYGLLCIIIMQLAAEPVIGLFSENAEVVLPGSQYMRGYVLDCVLAGIHFCFSGYFCAYGLSGISFFHNFVSILCARIPLAYLASIRFPDTLFPMGLATTTGSALSVVICTAVFVLLDRKKHDKRLPANL